METENKALGAGIITLCVLIIIGAVFSIGGAIFLIAMGDKLATLYKSANVNVATLPTMPLLIIELIIAALTLASAIFILKKKNLGIYGYLVMVIISIISTIIFQGFSISILLSLIIPVLMIIFYRKKKEIFS